MVNSYHEQLHQQRNMYAHDDNKFQRKTTMFGEKIIWGAEL